MGERIHFLGICGIGMASLAAQLARGGFIVTGSDASPEPPASTILSASGIEPAKGYAPYTGVPPDAVIVGNAIKADNAELRSLTAMKVPVLSLPQGVNRFLLDGVPTVVVAGTHGKTTTTALIAHGLLTAGRSPRVFVGGMLAGSAVPPPGNGNIGVVEGDEYDTAHFDKGAKLMHYRARWAVLTDLEYDHADIYPSVEAIEQVFASFVARNVEPRGLLVYRGENARLARVAAGFQGRVASFGGSNGTIRYETLSRGRGWTEGRLAGVGLPGGVRFRWGIMGVHNLANAAAATPVWLDAGLTAEEIAAALSTFAGVSRRMEVVLDGPVTVIDDFAHHPTAVRAAISTVRAHYPGRTLLAVFEPRSATSRRRIFEHEYCDALGSADLLYLLAPQRMESIPEHERLDAEGIVRRLREGGMDAVLGSPEPADLARFVAGHGECVVLVMTSGPSNRLIEALTGT